MTVIEARARYRRSPSVLWRDTGRHVVALPSHSTGRPQVLAGGSAVLWRLLEEPCSLEELHASLAGPGVAAPTTDEVASCLADLEQLGILAEVES